MTATIHSTSTRPTSPLFHLYTCPACNLTEQVNSADAQVGHRCPAKARMWMWFDLEGK